MKACLKSTDNGSACERWQETILKIILAEENLHIFLDTQRSLQVWIQLRPLKQQPEIGTQGPMKKNSQGLGPKDPSRKTARDGTPRPTTRIRDVALHRREVRVFADFCTCLRTSLLGSSDVRRATCCPTNGWKRRELGAQNKCWAQCSDL